MSDSVVRLEYVGSTARVFMNRPDVRNAFNADLIKALRDTFAHLASDSSVRSIVLAGEGKVFSGGADVQWMRAALDLTEYENIADAEAMAE
jgi:methylglutaconyl-CoA hydratase